MYFLCNTFLNLIFLIFLKHTAMYVSLSNVSACEHSRKTNNIISILKHRNFAWDFALSKIYSNALLSTLNARLGWDNLKGPGQHEDNVLFGAEIEGISTASLPPRKRHQVTEDSIPRSMGRSDYHVHPMASEPQHPQIAHLSV